MDKLTALRLILGPLIRYCVRKNISVQELTEVCKSLMIKAAVKEIEANKDKVNTSRISVITGLNRREVSRLQKQVDSPKLIASYASRVIGQWENDPEFLNNKKQPRPLSMAIANNEFKNLVAKISKDINHGTVLYDLERTDAIIRKGDMLKLKRTSFSPVGNVEEGFNVLSEDIDDLLLAVEGNLNNQLSLPNLHGRTEFDKIPQKDLPKIKEWILAKGSKFHQEIRKFLVRYDQDFNIHNSAEPTAKVVVTAFSNIEMFNKKESH